MHPAAVSDNQRGGSVQPIEAGELIHAITIAVLASFIVTWVLLAGYRRAVARTMRTASAQADLDPSMVSQIARPAAPFAPPVQAAIGATATRRRLALVYGAAFALSALVLALPFTWKLVQESGFASWPGLFANWMTIWAPSVVLICALLAASRRSTIVALIVAWLLVVLSVTALPAIVRLMTSNYSMAGLAANAWQGSLLFLVNAIPPLALVYITGRRRVRNVLPVVLVMVMLLSFLLLGFNRWQMANVQDISTANPMLMWLVMNIGVFTGPALLFLLISLPVGLLAWWLLLHLERRYQEYGFSNVQLVVDAWRSALRSLVERARVVLMDLRGFTKANAGCVFELEQLKAMGAVGRCVFVIDSTTDRGLVESSLALTSGALEQPAWIMMKREAAAMPGLWRELAQRGGVAPAAAVV